MSHYHSKNIILHFGSIIEFNDLKKITYYVAIMYYEERDSSTTNESAYEFESPWFEPSSLSWSITYSAARNGLLPADREAML